MIFRITKKDKIKYFYKPILIIFLLSGVFALILKYYNGSDLIMYIKILIGTFIGQSFLFLVPLSIFYFNYLKKDKGTELTIIDGGDSFIYKNINLKVSFDKNDLKKVIFHLSPPLYDKRSTWLYWDDYFYSEIITSKGNFKISCLVINNLKKFISKDKLEIRKVYFPLMK